MAKFQKLRYDIHTEAKRLGFTHFGIAPAQPAPHFAEFHQWIESGYHGEMAYLEREDALAKRSDSQRILQGCQRVICLALPYHPPNLPDEPGLSGKGRISAYATSQDYHHVMWAKLAQLEAFICHHAKEGAKTKSYVDTGPVLERSYAAMAGIGSAGKHTNLIIPGAGSFFFLAEILTDLPLPIDTPFTQDLCGKCQRCINACPTNCILPNRTIDASRCISYLTIECKGIIPDDLKTRIGTWVFGCDVCQMVCPHNDNSFTDVIAELQPMQPEELDLLPLFDLDEDAFSSLFGNTPLTRTKRKGILRNAAIALGNQRCQDALPVLKQALAQEMDPGLQDACRWAIHHIIHARHHDLLQGRAPLIP